MIKVDETFSKGLILEAKENHNVFKRYLHYNERLSDLRIIPESLEEITAEDGLDPGIREDPSLPKSSLDGIAAKILRSFRAA